MELREPLAELATATHTQDLSVLDQEEAAAEEGLRLHLEALEALEVFPAVAAGVVAQHLLVQLLALEEKAEMEL